jgi:hypothetical protein
MIDIKEQPRDTLNGLPLPMWYEYGVDYNAGLPEKERRKGKDEHHAYYPKPVLESGDVALQALRDCRVQYGPRGAHNRFHASFGPPLLPKTASEIFTHVFFAALGYIPDRGIALSGIPRVVSLAPSQRAALAQPNSIYVSNGANVRSYLLCYVMEQCDGLLTPDIVDEFLHTQRVQDRNALGECVLEMACRESVVSLEERYNDARRLHRLPVSLPVQAWRGVFEFIMHGSASGPDQVFAWLGNYMVNQNAQVA